MLQFRSQAPWLLVILMAFPLLFYACGGPPKDPLADIVDALKKVPDASIILEDMKVDGSIVKSYHHKYKVIQNDQASVMDWSEVPKSFYQKYEPFLGMTIWSKKDNQVNQTAGPPGYEYVGDPKYGEWRSDSSGQSFWVFYGQYRLLSDLLGGGMIYRHDYDRYRTHRSQNRPYYGQKNQYGTQGAYTKTAHPNFYQRKVTKSQSSFSNKVNNRIGRTRTSSRSRSGGIGK